MTLRLGLLSTANINDEILGGAATTDAVDVVTVGTRNRLPRPLSLQTDRAHAAYSAVRSHEP